MNSKTKINSNNSLDNEIIFNHIKKNNINILKITKIENTGIKVVLEEENIFKKIKFEDNENFKEEILEDIFSSDEEEILIENNFEKVKNNIGNNQNIVKSINFNNKNLISNKEDKENLLKLKFSECIICLENFENNQKIIELNKCNHYFHYKCLYDWIIYKNLKKSCPICR